jgi:hypothetical protein
MKKKKRAHVVTKREKKGVKLSSAFISNGSGKVIVYLNKDDPAPNKKTDRRTKFFQGITLFNFLARLYDLFV